MTARAQVSALTLTCAVRYAMGRQSYVVQEVARDVIKNAARMSRDDRRMIARDLDDFLREADGHPRDLVREWSAARDALQID